MKFSCIGLLLFSGDSVCFCSICSSCGCRVRGMLLILFRNSILFCVCCSRLVLLVLCVLVNVFFL